MKRIFILFLILGAGSLTANDQVALKVLGQNDFKKWVQLKANEDTLTDEQLETLYDMDDKINAYMVKQILSRKP